MDASIAGRAQTLPPTESWARPAPAGEATLVPPARSVRPPDDAERARDKKRERSGNEANSDHGAPHPNPQPDAASAPQREIAPAAGPAHEPVFPEAHLSLESIAACDTPRFDAPRFGGLLGKRAYASRANASRDDEPPRITKSV
ncbi:hypothetical protein [Microbaculum marinisediminis]|uniref:Uncharacterized protein n=1 Tax=Microbaculum marinisediminis TaxID=2931392 RepID=A0AAW5R1S2_9HYPH|nr:hypothetical protein [Microbaculum sp. A6E488]MCT8972818.1 hypothetical protein [Microbaculum sp. A6E488]